MSRFLKTLYRKSFWSRGKRQLFDVFAVEPDTIEAIVLEEIGLPKGRSTIRVWWKTRGSAFYKESRRRALYADLVSLPLLERPPSEFDKLFAFIKKADVPLLQNITSAVRDGVVYFAAWGSPTMCRDVTIRNPVAQSRQHAFVQHLKNNVWVTTS